MVYGQLYTKSVAVMVTKKQHYVPQFLLRNFSPAVAPGRIRVYRIPEGKFLGISSTTQQAHENHFYGSQEVEKGLAKLESATSAIIGQAIDTESLPLPGSKDHHILHEFTLTQTARTRGAADDADDEVDRLTRRMLQDHPELKEHLDKVKFSWPNAPVAALAIAMENFVYAVDLGYKLLCNRTTRPFLLSDNPAVMYNQFLEPRKKEGGNTGLAVKGLQVFLPLGPRHQLVFFDKDVYKVGGKRITSQRVEVEHEADVFALNLLQAVNAEVSLFFGDHVSESDIVRLMQKARKYRREERGAIVEYPPESGDENGEGMLLRFFKHDVRTHLKLKCIRLTPHAEKYDMGSQLIPFRQPEVRRMLNEFHKAVQKGKYEPQQLEQFADDVDSGRYVPEPRPTERYQLVRRPVRRPLSG